MTAVARAPASAPPADEQTAYGLWPALLLGLAAALIYSHVETASVDAKLVAVAALVGLTVAGMARAANEMRVPGAVGLIAVYLAIASASVLWADDRSAAFTGLASVSKAAGVAVLLSLVVTSRRALHAALWGVILAGGVVATAALLQVVRPDLEISGLMSARSEPLEAGEIRRVSGPVGDPNFFAQLLVVTVALALERWRHAPALAARRLAGVIGLAALLATVATWSRGGLVALAVVSVVGLARFAGRRAVGALGAIVLASVLIAPGVYVNRIGSVTDAFSSLFGDTYSEDTAIRGRTSELLVGVNQFRDHPLAGVGIGNFETDYVDYAARVGLDSRREDRSAHNAAVEVAAETGILGFAAWLAILVAAFVRLRAAHREARRGGSEGDARLVEGLALALAGYLVAAMFLHTSYPMGLWLLVGLAIASPAALGAREVAPSPPFGPSRTAIPS